MKMITREALADWEEQLAREEKSAATREKYLRDVRRFAAFVGERAVDKDLVLEYKSKLAERYAVAGANSMLAAVNSFLGFIGRTDCRVKQFKVQKKAYCSEEKELTKAEYGRLLRAAEQEGNQRLKLLLETICGTGIRVSELQFITVEAVNRGEAAVRCKGKSRTVFLVGSLCRKLKQYAKEQGIATGVIFITKSGKPMDRSNIWRAMKNLCKQAKVNPHKVFPHNLRHLFARTFYGIEKDIAKLADILGHSNINTTRIYIVTTGAEHRRRLERMGLVV